MLGFIATDDERASHARFTESPLLKYLLARDRYQRKQKKTSKSISQEKTNLCQL
jgi:hypothetical protein